MALVCGKWDVFSVTLTFKEEQLNKLKLHTYGALNVHQKSLGGLFVRLSTQAYFQDVSCCRACYMADESHLKCLNLGQS